MFKKKKVVSKQNTPITSETAPFAFNEAYKSLRTNFSFATFDGELKAILITSSIPNEGKSSVAINLAQSLAESEFKVLLIDGDLRSPTLGRYLRFKHNQSAGLSNVLSGKASYREAIYHHPLLNVDVMMSGPIPPNAAELFGRNYTGIVFEELREVYDYIIVDTPPVGVVTDAAIIAKHLDGAIFSIGHNHSEKEVVKTAIAKLKNSGIKVLGAVLSNYDASKDIDASAAYEYQYHYDRFTYTYSLWY